MAPMFIVSYVSTSQYLVVAAARSKHLQMSVYRSDKYSTISPDDQNTSKLFALQSGVLLQSILENSIYAS